MLILLWVLYSLLKILSSLNLLKVMAMSNPTILEGIRERRLAKHLNQTELAQKLGIRQRQISDLERGTIDPRLSTVQDVARVLDLELMLVPRQLLPVVKGLIRAKNTVAENRPIYALDGDDERT
jgi:transcriptional regulator with XRE-family HTH domain